MFTHLCQPIIYMHCQPSEDGSVQLDIASIVSHMINQEDQLVGVTNHYTHSTIASVFIYDDTFMTFSK